MPKIPSPSRSWFAPPLAVALLVAGCVGRIASGGGEPGVTIDRDDGPSGGGDGGLPVPGPTGAACAAAPSFEGALTAQRELHVSRSGSDVDGDGSVGRPFASIERAAEAARPGTAIRVHAGTYPGDQYVGDLAGTAAAPIWIGGAPGEARPVLSGGDEGMHLSSVRYLVVHDLVVRGTVYNGINCDDSDDTGNPDASRYVVFRGLTIEDVGDDNNDCLKLSGLNDYAVLDSEFARCGGNGSGSGIDNVGCHHGLIARNRFVDLSASGVQVKGGSEDVEVRWNVLLRAGARGVNMGGSTDVEYFRPPLSTTGESFEARDVRAIANVIVGSDAPVAFVGCDGCLAAHNTIVSPTRFLVRILQETVSFDGYDFVPSRQGRFVDNLVVYARAAVTEPINIGPDTSPATFSFANNLWFAVDAPAAPAPALPAPEEGGLAGVDPGLELSDDGTVTLPPSSPAAGGGSAIAETTGDITGRCYAEPPSIGAFEAVR